MILHEQRIDYKLGDEIILKPLFDAHLGNTYCDERALRAYLAQDNGPNTYLITGGDNIDCITTKDIKRYLKLTDASKGDAIIDEQVDKLCSILEPYRGRILGLGTGNHESDILKYHGTHPIRRAAEKLGTTSIGFSWLVRIRFSENGSRGRTLVIRGHHGWGGGSRTQGGDLTKYSKDLTYWSADLFLYGHGHRLQSDRIDRLALRGNRLVSKPKYMFLCGSFLKTLSDSDIPTYSEAKGYPPISIGAHTIRITPTRDWLNIESDV